MLAYLTGVEYYSYTSKDGEKKMGAYAHLMSTETPEKTSSGSYMIGLAVEKKYISYDQGVKLVQQLAGEEMPVEVEVHEECTFGSRYTRTYVDIIQKGE